MHSPARFHFPTFGHLLFLLSKTRRVLLLFTVLQVERLDAYIKSSQDDDQVEHSLNPSFLGINRGRRGSRFPDGTSAVRVRDEALAPGGLWGCQTDLTDCGGGWRRFWGEVLYPPHGWGGYFGGLGSLAVTYFHT